MKDLLAQRHNSSKENTSKVSTFEKEQIREKVPVEVHNKQNDGAWSRPLYRPKRDRKPKSNEDFYYN